MNLKKLIFLALFLGLFYFIFIANFAVTVSIIIGSYILYRLYKVYSKNKRNKLINSKEDFSKSELGLFIALVAKVAKADGRVQELEAQLISNMFDDISKLFDERDKARLLMKDIFNDAKQSLDNIDELSLDLNNVLGRSILKRRQFMGFLIQLAFVDNGIGEQEDTVLRQIATALKITPSIYDTMVNKFENMTKNATQSMSSAQAYKILGVNENDDINTIKKQYRSLVRKYHPDIISSQDKGETYMQEATAKTQEINQAYQVIKEIKKEQ